MKPVAYQNQKRQYTLNYFIHKIGNLMTLEKNALQKSWKILFNETIDEKSLSDIEKICIDSLESERRISVLFYTGKFTYFRDKAYFDSCTWMHSCQTN